MRERGVVGKVLVAVAALGLVGSALVGVAPMQRARAAVSSDKRPFEQLSGKKVDHAVYRADPTVVDVSVPAPELPAVRAAATANIVVNYTGFSPEAHTAFEAAVAIWESQISAPITIVVDATYTPLDPGVLGSAGATWYLRAFDGAPRSDTWYPVALANQHAGQDLKPADADIEANFSSSFSNWYFGIDGNPPPGTYDFESVVLHELTHGLGFIGSMSMTGSLGYWGQGTGYPFNYDRFTENGAGTPSISYASGSVALGTHLRSNDVWFDGTQARAANGGNRPKLYAPSTWSAGSSYAHLDEATYGPGTPNALMTPALSSAESVHDPGPITLGIFQDLGWGTGGPELPGAPTAVSAQRRPGAAVVSFDPPADDGGAPITAYHVYPNPGGVPFATGTGSPIMARGLTNGTPYTFRVAAVNSAGEGPLSEPSNTITPVAGRYHPVTPIRILDTRTGNGGIPGPIGPNQTFELGVEDGVSPIPDGSNVSAVVINVAVTAPTKYGWLTLYPADQALPTVANLNFVAGQTVPNLATVSVSPSARLKATNSGGLVGAGSVHVIFDLVGWYDSDASGTAYNPISPSRILDTRFGTGGISGPLAPGQTATVDVTGVGGVPPDHVSAVIVNAAVTGPTKYGWLTLFPSGQPLPLASNLNFVAGQTVPNLAAIKVGGDGNIKVNNSGGLANAGSVHVVFDVVGWYDDGTVGGSGFTPVAPHRIVDTRFGIGGYGILGPQQTMSCDVTGVGGVPDDGVSGVIVNTTVTAPTRYGWLTLYPTGQSLPLASNLNFVAGQTVPNLAVVKTGPDGNINANNSGGYAAAGFVHVVMDVAGYFDTASGPPTVPDAPTGVSATPGDGQATVSFTPPANNGGSPITSYTATSDPDGLTGTSSGSPIVVNGLTNGTPYTFTVTATNAVGEGPPSDPSAAVTPQPPADGVVTEFALGGTGPRGITAGPDGNLWFTESSRIGRITPAGVLTEFTTGITAGAGVYDIALGPDGNLWFTEYFGSRIGRITPAGAVTEFSVGISPGSGPRQITAGPDGNLWFTEQLGHRIGRITPAGVITEFSAGVTPGGSPRGITAGPDGNVWFTEYLADKIGRITPDGTVTEFDLTGVPGPWDIALGPDGNLWFTEEWAGDTIGRITPAGVVTEFSAGITADSAPQGITAGPGGTLWFTEYDGNRIGRITTAGVVTEFSAGITAAAGLWDIALGPDGNLWFTEYSGNRVGRITSGV